MADLSVLIPLDGSKAAELAVTALASLRPLGAIEVRLLNVTEPDGNGAATGPAHGHSSYMEEIARRARVAIGMEVHCLQRPGRADEVILSEAGRGDIDLLLMSTHGHTSYDPERLGSVATRVARGASCPVMLVGAHASVPLAIERIAVPLDGSRLAAEALPVARGLAERLAARLRLVRAIPYESEFDSDAIGSLMEDVVESQELTASLYLSEARLELETGGPVETAVLRGPPAEALLRDLQENRPDLVVMTSHGHGGFMRWALGSVTERLLRGPVPVLVVRPAEAATRSKLTARQAQP